MKYIKVLWIHNFDDVPYIFYHEIDGNGFEIRKVEIYKDESFGLASEEISFGGTELSEKGIPEIEEINKDGQFIAQPIERDEFEAIWKHSASLYSGM